MFNTDFLKKFKTFNFSLNKKYFEVALYVYFFLKSTLNRIATADILQYTSLLPKLAMKKENVPR